MKQLIQQVSQQLQSHLQCKRPIIFVEPSCGDARILIQVKQQFASNSHAYIGYDIDSTVLPPNLPVVKCRDYLQTSLADVLKDCNFNPTNQAQQPLVVVVGGPPYNGDLPLQFVNHSLDNLGAALVVFIMPFRCRHDARAIQTLELPNCFFEFASQERITQPSVLQIWRSEI